MRGGRGNVTKTHLEDVSLGALFLMAKRWTMNSRLDGQQLTQSKTLTGTSQCRLTTTLLETKVIAEGAKRNSPPFADPTDTGRRKITTTSWVADTLLSTSIDDLELEVSDTELADLNYELSDVI